MPYHLFEFSLDSVFFGAYEKSDGTNCSERGDICGIGKIEYSRICAAYGMEYLCCGQKLPT